jgi:hypothetical protein
MRKLLGRTAASAALAIAALAPLTGTASAAAPVREARPSVTADDCCRHHGVQYCDDERAWQHHPVHHGPGSDVGL